MNAVRPFAAINALAALVAAAALFSSCGQGRRVSLLEKEAARADLSLPSDRELAPLDMERPAERDTITVTDSEGREMILMNAVRDEAGEMVAHDVIEAAVVTARFRNVAERHGKVDLRFNITVPASMQGSAWQLRLHPDLFVMEDSLRLETLVITGEGYRKAQLRGYQHYERFLASIVQDSTRFINLRQLEIFLQRNIPALYAFKNDSTIVSDERFHSVFGVSEQEAVEHYTDKLARGINRWKDSRKGLMYERLVKAPIVTEGIRLDTVMRSGSDFVYCYTQTIATRPGLRKADVVLGGEIWESSRRIYTVPRSEPLTFYISSLSAFADGTERYLTKVVERRAEANAACYIDFAKGSADIDETSGNNPSEIGRIKRNLRDILSNEKFDLDSIVVTASASPEGSYFTNALLAGRRSASVAEYFREFLRRQADSIAREEGLSLNLDGSLAGRKSLRWSDIRFISRRVAENWEMLDGLVRSDETLEDCDRDEYFSHAVIADPDLREAAMQGDRRYGYYREVLYPRVRTVRFDFFLHRKGMVKDTVHTTVLDGNYMAGVQALRDRDYLRAVEILRPYNDFNAAVAFTAMDLDASAMAILKDLPPTGEVEYLRAIIFYRRGETQKAVQSFLNAVSLDRSFLNRGNLDPEISSLIKTFGLDRREEDNYEYSY